MSGKGSLPTSPSDLLLLADHCLGTRLARRVRVSGSQIRTIQEEWPGRDLQSDPPMDDEIIRHLETRAGSNALWITQDWHAFSRHGEALYASPISVLWLRWPRYSILSSEDKAQVVQSVIETVYDLILESNAPVYFRTRLAANDRRQPILERLTGTVLDRPIEWEPVPL